MMRVVSETRTVYRGAAVAQRKWKLTRHAAYVAVAKAMIANRCNAMDLKIEEAWGAECDEAKGWVPGPYTCGTGVEENKTPCRFHKQYPSRPCGTYGEEVEGGGMEYYAKVRDRLVRFLKFLDAREDSP